MLKMIAEISIAKLEDRKNSNSNSPRERLYSWSGQEKENRNRKDYRLLPQGVQRGWKR